MAKKVLIVDDSSSVRTVARMALREKGYDVVEASNGQEAPDEARWRALPPGDQRREYAS